MTTFDDLIVSRAGEWAVFAQIEGIGPHLSVSDLSDAGDDARTRFCIQAPAYAAGEPAGVWRPDLFSFPQILSEQTTPEGGVTEYGAGDVVILDRADYLSGLIRPDAPPVTLLSSALAAGATSVGVESTARLAATSVLWVEDEAMKATAAPGGGAVSVKRGYLGTDERAHPVGAAVFTSIPYLGGRRLEIYVAPLRAASSAEARLVGSYAIDTCEWVENLNCWRVGGRSEVQAVDAILPAVPRGVEVVSMRQDESVGRGEFLELRKSGTTSEGVSSLRLWTGTEASTTLFFLQNDTETLGIEAAGSINRSVLTGRRGVAETVPKAIKPGTVLPQVLVADREASSFRYSPGPTPSASRSSGTWVRSDHWVDIALCMLTSSAHPDDGLELVNYVSSRGNWSCLPAGYGAGVLASSIDWDSWLEAKQRTFGLRFPNFTVGQKPRPIGEILTNELLRPVGAYMTSVNGSIRVVVPQSPAAGSATYAAGANEIIRINGEYVPDVSLELDIAGEAADVRFSLGPQGVPVTATHARAGRNARSIVIDVPGASKDDGAIWALLAEARLAEGYKPAIKARMAVDYSLWGASVGDVGAVTVPELPDLRTGLRGWSGMLVQLAERTVNMDADRGVWIEHIVRAYGQAQQVGKISAAAVVASVASATATVLANAFTKTDAIGLPVADASAFEVGQSVALVDATGVDVGGTFQTVVSISGDNIELDGDFSGSLAADAVLVFSDAGNAIASQLLSYVFFADGDDYQTNGGEPYVYAGR